jgi:kelch-like protein 10
MLLTRLPVARAFMGAAVVGDELYTVGGFDGTQELADADHFNMITGRWESLPALNTGRSGLALVYDDVGLHALGGGWLQNVDTNERFDLATGTWAIVPSPVAGSWRHLGAVSADGALFLMGGWNGDYMDLATSYQSTFRSLLPVITNP